MTATVTPLSIFLILCNLFRPSLSNLSRSMASLQAHPTCLRFQRSPCLLPPNLRHFPNPIFPGRICLSSAPGSVRFRGAFHSVRCLNKNNSEVESVPADERIQRPPFDINLAVILAGFAFEAYTSPPENEGRREIDAADCQTVYLSESFVREIYDGQLFIKLKKGLDLPAMDPWGTSDPYVVMQLDGQVVKSKIKWGTKKPTWNEEFTFHTKFPPTKNLQVAAWDANLITPHKRMGNAGINLECFSDGNSHEVLVELEGMGGGGKILLEVKHKKFEQIEDGRLWWRVPFVSEFLRNNGFESALKMVVGSDKVKYKNFKQIEDEKTWWRVPFVSEFLRNNGFDSALKMVVGSEKVQARQFVEYAFGKLKSFNDVNLWKDWLMSRDKYETEGIQRSNNSVITSESPSQMESKLEDLGTANGGIDQSHSAPVVRDDGTAKLDAYYWKNFADIINENVVKKLGVPVPEKLKWDGFDLLNGIGLQSRKIAEAGYIESGLAAPENQDVDSSKTVSLPAISAIQSSLPDIKKATKDLLKQTDSVLGALMVLTAAVSQLNKEGRLGGDNETTGDKTEDNVAYSKNGKLVNSQGRSVLDEKKAEEMKALFSTAESAMEAWAMLATSLGQSSFIKSEFEKICFLDNETTDTQVAIWRDSVRRRLVVAFRGTEQARWKDLRTDLMLAPAGLNPERLGGDFKQEVQVHSGFLSAYDSVRIRIISLIKLSIGYKDDHAEPPPRWHVYVTGHSLGGALATLLALELSSSLLAKCGAIFVTMYNFGSPRVGNKRFAEVYNEKVKDSWRVVNHRDIIPTVPRLMGYCHVAQPVYLAAGNLSDALVNIELLEDGYQGDVIGESTPDVLVSEFMKGERELIDKILQTEINIFLSIRDGTALMQHMEDFYYITLLENVRSNNDIVAKSQSNELDSSSAG